MISPRPRASAGPDRLLPFFGAGGLVITILAVMARDYPWVGHDFRYFIPRLIDTDLHLRLNGPAIQWYTPTFGGGLPAFPNPQHLQYSLTQAMTLVVNPWWAVLATTAIVALAGYAALYRFARASLGLTVVAATLCAIFLVGNGFFIEHLIVGHLGFQLFPLGAVMLSVLTDRRRPTIVNGALVALVAAMMLYQAGFYLLIIVGLSMALTVPLLAVHRASLVDWRRLSITIAVALVLFGGLGATKAYAALAFMRQFPRQAADVYSVGLPEALAGLVAQLTGAMVLAPLLALMGMDPARVSGALMQLTGADVRSGLWEIDTGLSPVLIVVLVTGLVWFARDCRTHGWPHLQQSQKRALALLAVVTWIVIEATLARGFIYPWLKPLPVLNSLHVNHRLASAFVLPLSIAGALLIDRWQWQARQPLLAWAVIAISTFAPAAYFLLPAQAHLRTFDLSASLEASRLVRGGDRLEVAAIVDGDDAAALVAGASSLRPYEPLFGYANETFAPKIHAGDVHDTSDGFLNMTNPASLVFPDINGVRPFDRIAVSERDQLDQFAARRQPRWRVPVVEQWLNVAAVVCLAIAIVLLFLNVTSRIPVGRR